MFCITAINQKVILFLMSKPGRFSISSKNMLLKLNFAIFIILAIFLFSLNAKSVKAEIGGCGGLTNCGRVNTCNDGSTPVYKCCYDNGDPNGNICQNGPCENSGCP